jgi:hypothetical protein
MKKSLVLVSAALSLLCTSRALAQGDVQFDNVTGTPAWTVSLDGVLVGAGSAVRAELWWAAGSSQPEASLAPTGIFATLTDWFGNGSFFKGVVTIPGAAPGQAITLQVRAWDPQTGSSYDTALTRGKNSTTANYTTPSGLALPDPINGLDSFNVVVVPEPSTFALLGLGTGVLLFLRRRK